MNEQEQKGGQKKKKSPMPSSAGKRRGQREIYFRTRFPINKLRRILQSNGLKEATLWAAAHAKSHGAEATLKKLLAEKDQNGRGMLQRLELREAAAEARMLARRTRRHFRKTPPATAVVEVEAV